MSLIAQSEPVIRHVTEIASDDLDLIRECLEINRSIQKQITGEKWLNSEDAARYIKKSVTHLRKVLKDQIGYSKPDHEILFKVEDLDRYLMKHYRPAQD